MGGQAQTQRCFRVREGAWLPAVCRSCSTGPARCLQVPIGRTQMTTSCFAVGHGPWQVNKVSGAEARHEATGPAVGGPSGGGRPSAEFGIFFQWQDKEGGGPKTWLQVLLCHQAAICSPIGHGITQASVSSSIGGLVPPKPSAPPPSLARAQSRGMSPVGTVGRRCGAQSSHITGPTPPPRRAVTGSGGAATPHHSSGIMSLARL